MILTHDNWFYAEKRASAGVAWWQRSGGCGIAFREDGPVHVSEDTQEERREGGGEHSRGGDEQRSLQSGVVDEDAGE